MKPARFQCLDNVIFDRSLSGGARSLYTALHILSAERGECYQTQEQLAARLGFSPRHIRRFIFELINAKYLVTDKTNRANRYQLPWFSTGLEKRTPMSSQVLNEDTGVLIYRTPMSSQEACIRDKVLKTRKTNERYTACRCGNPNRGEETVRCWRCGHVYDPMTVSAIAGSLEFVRNHIWSYVECWKENPGAGCIDKSILAAPPDERICQQALDAVDGCLELLAQRLRAVHEDTAIRPRKSYAWFVAILKNNKTKERRSA